MSGLLPAAHISLPEDLTKATLDIASRLQRLRPGPRNRLVEEIEDVLLSGSSQTPEPCPILDEATVRELGLQPFAELGAHTHNHAMLSTLSGEEQLSEISLSVARLHAISGTRPRFLAYPYGGEHDYNVDSCLAARDAGLEAAFVNHAGPFDPIRSPYRVPRYYVPPLPADQFRRIHILSRVFTGWQEADLRDGQGCEVTLRVQHLHCGLDKVSSERVSPHYVWDMRSRTVGGLFDVRPGEEVSVASEELQVCIALIDQSDVHLSANPCRRRIWIVGKHCTANPV
jgi:hypothetical protein